MTINDIFSYTIYAKGGLNSDRLIELLNKFLLEQKSKLIILDNASCHWTKIAKNLKLRVILYYYKSKNQTQTSKIFGCSPRTWMRWVNQDKLNNNFFSNKKVRYGGY